jgi:hypothetical protein
MQLKLGKYRVLVVSDIQEPFAHPDAVRFVRTVKSHYKTDTTVFIGDEIDAYSLSRYPKDPNAKSAGDEFKSTRNELKKWFKLCEDDKLVRICNSNHTQRIFKRLLESGIPGDFLKGIREILGAPNSWVWEDSFVIDGVKYEHGDSQGGVDAARLLAISNRCSTVIGHHHSHGGVRFMANDDSVIFGLNVGCLIDRATYAFRYGKSAKFKPTLGCGVVIQGVPYFVPMVVGEKERWIGRLIV